MTFFDRKEAKFHEAFHVEIPLYVEICCSVCNKSFRKERFMRIHMKHTHKMRGNYIDYFREDFTF